MRGDRYPGLRRREFVKAAVAIGGASALAACAEREGTASAGSQFPTGPTDLGHLPERQHAWGSYIVHDAHGNTVLPQHQVLLFLDYAGSGTPTADDRETVEAALRNLERAHQRGTAGNLGAAINQGLLFTLGYSPSYFDRFDADLPSSLDVRRPEDVLSAVGEDPTKAEHHDALLVLSADYGSILLGAEQALLGERDSVNGVRVEATFDGVFEVADRRTGFVGKGLPAENLDAEEIPEHAPMSMGFKSGFRDNLPGEDRVTIPDGPFAEGTTQHASRLRIDLDRWYDLGHERRVHQMFSPQHDVGTVGETGEGLGGDSGITEDIVDDIEADAERTGCVGHTAKTARARDDEFFPVILRRSEGIATDVAEAGTVGFNFTSVQRRMQDFIDTRKAMNPEEYDVDVDDPHHGIVDFLETRSRANFLVPPRSLRALPSPRPDRTEG